MASKSGYQATQHFDLTALAETTNRVNRSRAWFFLWVPVVLTIFGFFGIYMLTVVLLHHLGGSEFIGPAVFTLGPFGLAAFLYLGRPRPAPQALSIDSEGFSLGPDPSGAVIRVSWTSRNLKLALLDYRELPGPGQSPNPRLADFVLEYGGRRWVYLPQAAYDRLLAQVHAHGLETRRTARPARTGSGRVLRLTIRSPAALGR